MKKICPGCGERPRLKGQAGCQKCLDQLRHYVPTESRLRDVERGLDKSTICASNHWKVSEVTDEFIAAKREQLLTMRLNRILSTETMYARGY